MTPLEELIQLKQEDSKRKFPNFPYPVKPKYTDKTANGLTKCVVDYVNLKGGQAERISTTGRYIDNSRIVTNVLNQTYKVGSGSWIPGNTRLGSADVSAVIPVIISGREIGLSVKFEIKIGKDKMSAEQIEYSKEIINAKGLYFVVKDFTDFYEKYHWILDNYK